VIGIAERGNKQAASVRNSLESKLVARGYTVSANPDEAVDITANVDYSVEEHHGLLTVYVNGRPKVDYVEHALPAITVSGVAVADAKMEFDPMEGASAHHYKRIEGKLSHATLAQRACCGQRAVAPLFSFATVRELLSTIVQIG
jgi:phosphoglucomutase